MSLNRLRKLLALAADRAGTPEGETAARLARRILHEHNLSVQSLPAEAQEEADPFVRRELLLGGPAGWRCRLLSVVAQHCECVASYRRGAGRGWLHGRRGAVDLAEHLYVVLGRALSRERLLLIAQRGGDLAQAERDAEANRFCLSAILALEGRLQASREEEPTEQRALAVRRRSGLDGWMGAQGHAPRREPPFTFTLSAEGYAAGWRLPLHDAVTGCAEPYAPG